MKNSRRVGKIKRKTLLYKSGVEYADYGLNHVEGCTHGCRYPCYAMMMKKRCGVVNSYQEWIQPKIVENSLELLDKEIPRLKGKIKEVFLCFSTDPFMYQVKEVEDLTLKILERFNEENIKSTLISKGTYPKVLAQDKYNKLNEYGSTVVSLDDEFQNKFEPGASSVKDRIKALRDLHDAGLKTWVSMEPYPTPNVVKQDIRKILEEISFVDKIVFGKWNYSQLTSSFLNYKKFYNSMTEEVLKFCEENDIEVHIKDKTIDLRNTNSETEKKILCSYLDKFSLVN